MDKKQAETTEERFKALLRELFQFTKADLNFGIYRVMNHKREEWGKFIDEKIVAAVDKALSGAGDKADNGDTPQDILRDMIIGNLGKSAFSAKNRLKPDYCDTPYGKLWLVLEKTLGKAAPLPKALRDEVFNRLYEFFSRYYDEGDFMCKRRHSAAGRYAIPYNGEEVLLHWANRDQYYIKTAEHFLRYEYKNGESKNAAVIRFEMHEAELPKDNNKANNKRYFIPLTKAFATVQDNGRVFVLPFEYRPLSEKEQLRLPKNDAQDTIIDEAVTALKGNKTTAAPFLTAMKDENTLLIAYHIRRYARRNTADYFIHKNLRRFLREELDFYIKNEVLNAEEIAHTGENTKARFIVAGATRKTALMTIDFLAQMEDFQKAIWEKKKFITQTEYCLTVGLLKDNKLRDKIAANEGQWAEWRALNFCNGIKAKAKRLAFMDENPTLPLDTVHFDGEFKDTLLAGFDDLETITDGVLFHGENWQALNLMQEKYQERIKCIYIDPPYNTGNDGFLYDDKYKHSSWMTMMHDRLFQGRILMKESGVIFLNIGDLNPQEGESFRLQLLTSQIFPKRFGNLIWRKRSSIGSFSERDMTENHEYILLHGNSKSFIYKNILTERRKSEFSFYDKRGQYRWMPIIGPTQQTKTKRPNLDYGVIYDNDNKKIVGFSFKAENTTKKHMFDNQYGSNLANITLDGDSTWLFGKDVMEKFWKQGILQVSKNGDGQNAFKIEIRNYLYNDTGLINGTTLKSILSDNDMNIGMNKEATTTIKNLFYPKDYSDIKPKPVSLVKFLISTISVKQEKILDYFAGSGTTAHAVINLNREDGGRRKFILVEMGEYFDTVLLPRIKKVIYTPEWKEGKPKRLATKEEAQRSPRLVKYYRMESYDDALDNIAFDEEISRPLLKFDDYAPRYMLQTESRACATFVSGEMLKKPFAYTLRRANKEEKNADLPETFAYLIGLKEKTRRTFYDGKRRYVVQTGEAQGRQTTVIWRDTDKWKSKDFEKDREFVNKQKLMANAERVYVNDDSIIKGAQSLSPIFRDKMFPTSDED